MYGPGRQAQPIAAYVSLATDAMKVLLRYLSYRDLQRSLLTARGDRTCPGRVNLIGEHID